MRTYDVAHTRNTVLLAHGGAGKTSLSEAALFSSAAITRQGKVTEGNTTSDFEAEEVKRHISISLSLLPCEWKGHKLNIIDTPGYADFVGEVVAALRAADSAIVVVDAAAGVEVGTEQVWQHADKQSLPRLVFVNKMDRENADFARTLEQVQAVLGKKCVALQIPIGAQADFLGVVDLVNMKAYMGTAAEEKEIPAALVDQAKALREKLIESVAETSDELISKYLEEGTLTQEELTTGVRQGPSPGRVPVLAGSVAEQGVARLLMRSMLPSPGNEFVQAKGQGDM